MNLIITNLNKNLNTQLQTIKLPEPRTANGQVGLLLTTTKPNPAFP